MAKRGFDVFVNMLKRTITPLKWHVFVFCSILGICINVCLLKNITLAGNFIFTGMKIDFHACVFRFGPTGILMNRTISNRWQ